MAIVQAYRGQAKLGSKMVPIQLGGGSVDWDARFIVPQMAGNFAPQLYTEGLQMPMVNLTYVLLDTAAVCPCTAADLAAFIARSNDAAHDVAAIADGIEFFDGFSGWAFPHVKPGGFSIGGTKGQPITMQASYGVFLPDGGTAPSALSAAIDATYAPFAGTPLTWKNLEFYLANGTTEFPGIQSFQLSYNNNLTPDLSMVGRDAAAGQSSYPIDLNATGEPSATLSLTFQGDSASHIAVGDGLVIKINGANVDATIKVNRFLPSNHKSRNIGQGRVMRTYSGQLLAAGNTDALGLLYIS